MPTSVLFHCPCTDEPKQSEPPSLPSYSPAAVYSYFPLQNLYFCDDCDQVRCDRCLNIEISQFFCPSCMFTIQSSHIKEQRNRCDRNCFLCPICTNTLVTVPSDPQEDFPPESKEASIGGAPYYLFCTCCKWDSKEIKLEFERPTGLSMQLQRSEEQSYDVLELQKLQDHFASVLKPSSKKDGTSAHRSTPATLRASKLLRDVPALATNSKYLQGRSHQALPSLFHGRGGQGGRPEPITEWTFPGDPKPYEAQTSFASATGEELSVLGRREESNRDFVRATSDDQLITSLEQRWTAPTLPPRVQDLRPQRVPASFRATKRCSVCNHICIRPDVKSGFHRFKIKTFFGNYVPDITVAPSTLQPMDLNSDQSALSRLSRGRTSISIRTGAGMGGRPGGRPQSVFGAAGLGLSSGMSSVPGTQSSLLAPRAVDVENLRPGGKYVYELVFANPLPDRMNVSIVVAKPSAAAAAGGYGFGASQNAGHTAGAELRSPRSPGEGIPLSPGGSSIQTSVATPLRLPWQVTPSAESFPVAPNNDLLDDLDGAATLGNIMEDSVDMLDDDVDFGANDDGADGDDDDLSRSGRRRPGKRKAGFKQNGHRTTISLELALGNDASGEIEFGLFVSYNTQLEGSVLRPSTSPTRDRTGSPTKGHGHGANDKVLSFWTAVRLGRCASRTHLAQLGHSGLSNLAASGF
ncbi:unnamed protein product [Tilletia controversa]|uniref:Dynactin subunit 4 n=1 Tax=Tilletia controversa TaxID=13291 RepID=A0A8X7MZV9_9BASI|nr:hypothetical protein CF328_g2659 [Tilletia controversa]KAE8256166.1 hypothetical protein A4X06_0g61 [Tilletia controversa]CAD6932240.1 unnamed protein product [Tilletia controversa]CAD6944198.1 unnamed protein product [Tilletia controversa]CAD6947249.1 unnamed protein product [Tilletia controversa]